MAQFLTFQNTAGPNEGQAIALLDQATHTAYYKCVFLAQSKPSLNSLSGFIFQNCNVTVSPEIAPSKDNVTVFLGRPWRMYSMVVFIDSFLDNVVQPKGWLEWPGVPENLLYYAEYNNSGGGANTSQRVNWPGYHALNNAKEVATFTVETFINGTQWLPQTGIPFRAGF
uniref:Pectinesterase catalytic domain-containing protein n=1 Tax=Cucumis sativus TaxID=3659 RepID=A0A0A0KQN0_CUCSA